ncbi:MAG: DUF502 domain-containing protein [Sedimentisphaerales bacterium]|nr:DUF502 domain-containing protein [Sedimentisphaerales bacterium]
MAITRRFRSYFLRGLAVLLPTILTIWIFILGYNFIQGNISIHINRGLVRLIMLARGIDGHNADARKPLVDFWVYGWGSTAGFLIALVVVFVVGALLASVLGRTLWRKVEKFIMNTPFLRQVYPYVKQVTDLLLTRQEQQKALLRPVAVEYPRKGIWSIGYMTGGGIRKIVEGVDKEFVTILIPTAPTPLSGFVIMVPKEDTIDLDISVEEALRFIISAGVVTPLQWRSALPQSSSAANE